MNSITIPIHLPKSVIRNATSFIHEVELPAEACAWPRLSVQGAPSPEWPLGLTFNARIGDAKNTLAQGRGKAVFIDMVNTTAAELDTSGLECSVIISEVKVEEIPLPKPQPNLSTHALLRALDEVVRAVHATACPTGEQMADALDLSDLAREVRLIRKQLKKIRKELRRARRRNVHL